jgi:hypothetical protein
MAESDPTNLAETWPRTMPEQQPDDSRNPNGTFRPGHTVSRGNRGGGRHQPQYWQAVDEILTPDVLKQVLQRLVGVVLDPATKPGDVIKGSEKIAEIRLGKAASDEFIYKIDEQCALIGQLRDFVTGKTQVLEIEGVE